MHLKGALSAARQGTGQSRKSVRRKPVYIVRQTYTDDQLSNFESRMQRNRGLPYTEEQRAAYARTAVRRFWA